MMIRHKGIIYKDILLNIVWGGDIKTSTRYLEVSFKSDENINFECGDKVELISNFFEVLFIGDIFVIRKNTKEEYSFKAFDKAFRLNKNYLVKNYFNQLPSEITKGVLAEIGLQVGTLPKDAVRCTFPAWNRTAYSIILMCYKIQHNQDKKIYSIVSEGEKISVIEQGTLCNTKIIDGINILNANYSKSIEDIVNKVVLYTMNKQRPAVIGNKIDDESIKKYGVFQIAQEQDKSNAAYLQVQNILKKEEENAEIEVLGDTELISGFSVPIKINNLSNLNGVFLIKSDRHTWTANTYKTSLELAFENVMNDVDIETYPASKKKKKTEVVNDYKNDFSTVGGVN